MPITFVFMLFAFLGAVLLVPAAVASPILWAAGKKRHALVVVSIPIGMIAVSALLTMWVFVMAELDSRIASARPNHLFKVTFGFKPPAQTRILEAYHKTLMDYGTTVMKFSTTGDVIDKIVARSFVLSDRKALVSAYTGNSHNLPKRVQSWFSLPDTPTGSFYVANPFDNSFAYSEAVLWYDDQTQIACFHWVGAD